MSRGKAQERGEEVRKEGESELLLLLSLYSYVTNHWGSFKKSI